MEKMCETSINSFYATYGNFIRCWSMALDLIYYSCLNFKNLRQLSDFAVVLFLKQDIYKLSRVNASSFNVFPWLTNNFRSLDVSNKHQIDTGKRYQVLYKKCKCSWFQANLIFHCYINYFIFMVMFFVWKRLKRFI